MAEEFLEDGEDAAAGAHPVFEAVDAIGEEFAVLGVAFVAGGLGEA